ncbi:hypothetical protein QQ045_008677 [Rhodiola kirilowii]
MSSSSASSDYNTDGGDDEEEKDHHLPLSQLELPDLTAHLIHDTTSDSLDRHFPVAPEGIMANERTGRGTRLHRKTNKMIKEINNLKQQNFITHCLLGTMIVLTLGWQLSEVSLILTLKNGLTNPFRSIGNVLSKMVKRRSLNNSLQATEEESSLSVSLISTEPPHMLGMKMPELPKFLDLSKWGQFGNGQ